jgi:hypothetical protein
LPIFSSLLPNSTPTLVRSCQNDFGIGVYNDDVSMIQIGCGEPGLYGTLRTWIYILRVSEFKRSSALDVSYVTLVMDARTSALVDSTATGLTTFSLHARHSRFNPAWRDEILSIPKFNFSGDNVLTKQIGHLLNAVTDYDTFWLELRGIVGNWMMTQYNCCFTMD